MMITLSFCSFNWYQATVAKVDIRSNTVGESVVNVEPVVRNLGSWFDSQLITSTHISFFHLHKISRIRKFLSPRKLRP